MRRVGVAVAAVVVAIVLYFALRPDPVRNARGTEDDRGGGGCQTEVRFGDAGVRDASAPRRRVDAGVVRRPIEDAAPVGTASIVGEVRITWTPPPLDGWNRDSDPYCKALPSDASSVRVKDGRLENVLVRIADAPSRPGHGTVVLRQERCDYVPRVLGIVAGQTIRVTNGDQTMHNVHTYPPEGERPFNRAQVPGSPAIEVSYTTHGALVGFKCDVHPWMSAWVSVTNHPWFDVTNEDGVFEIPDLPAGTYTLEAWHERLGWKRRTVTLAAGAVVDATIEYDGTEMP